MKLTSVPLRSVIALLIGLVLCGCGSAPADVAPTEAPPPPTATAPPPMSTPPVPTSTTEPPIATPVPEEDDGAWDYVALGDSIPAGMGVDLGKSYVHLYADYIAEDLGVEVTVHNRSAVGETTVSLLGRLRSDEIVRKLVGEAEVITIWVGSNDIWILLYGPMGAGNPRCGPISDLDMDCFETEVQALVGRIDTILAEVRSLRTADQALVRIVNECNFFVEYWRDADAFEQLKEPAFEVWSQAISDLAAKHGVAVVHTYVACNGPEGDDPIAADYVQTWDPWHFNEVGHQMVADLHRAVGYDRGP